MQAATTKEGSGGRQCGASQTGRSERACDSLRPAAVPAALARAAAGCCCCWPAVLSPRRGTTAGRCGAGPRLLSGRGGLMAIWNAGSSAAFAGGAARAAATPSGLQSGACSSPSLSLASFSQLVDEPGEVRRAERGVAPPLLAPAAAPAALTRADSGVRFSCSPSGRCSFDRFSLAMGGRALAPGVAPPDSRRGAAASSLDPLPPRLSRDTCGGRVLTAGRRVARSAGR